MSPSSRPLRTPEPISPLRAALGLAAFAVIAGVLAALAGASSRFVSITAVLGVLLAALAPLHAGRLRGTGARGPTATYLALLAVAPVLGITAGSALEARVLDSTFMARFVRSIAHQAVAINAPVFVILSCIVGMAIATWVVAEVGARLDAVVDWSSLLVVFAATALVAGATLRAVRLPDADGWAEGLTVALALPPAVGVPTEELPPSPDLGWFDAQQVYVDVLEDVTLRRVCSPSRSELHLVRGGPAELEGLAISCAEVLEIRRDAVRDRWIVRGRAFDAKTLSPVDVPVSELRDELAPPRAFVLGGLAGVVLAGVLAARRRSLRRRLALISRGTPGQAEGNGWVTLEGDIGSVRMEGPAQVEGPVVVLAQGLRGPGAYRGQGSQGRVTIVVGDALALLEAGRAEVTTVGAHVLATLALTCAPLVAAALKGLVF